MRPACHPGSCEVMCSGLVASVSRPVKWGSGALWGLPGPGARCASRARGTEGRSSSLPGQPGGGLRGQEAWGGVAWRPHPVWLPSVAFSWKPRLAARRWARAGSGGLLRSRQRVLCFPLCPRLSARRRWERDAEWERALRGQDAGPVPGPGKRWGGERRGGGRASGNPAGGRGGWGRGNQCLSPGFSLGLCSPHRPPAPPFPRPLSLPWVFVPGLRAHSARAGQARSPWAHGVRRAPAGPARRQDGEGGEGGARGGRGGDGLGARETGARGTPPRPGEREGGGNCAQGSVGPPAGGGRRPASPPGTADTGTLERPGRPWGVTRRAGVEAAPATAADTSGLASGARHTTVQSSACAPRRRLAPMRSSAAPRARPRPPALTLPPAGSESLVHFSFGDEDTCWHPPGRFVRWVARGQSPPLPPEAALGVGRSPQGAFKGLPGAPHPPLVLNVWVLLRASCRWWLRKWVLGPAPFLPT